LVIINDCLDVYLRLRNSVWYSHFDRWKEARRMSKYTLIHAKSGEFGAHYLTPKSGQLIGATNRGN
jgi:hypothetical protein